MIADTERATAAVWDAARAIDEYRETGSEETAFEFAAAVAATLAPAAAQHCTQDCIQVHGGIGFTWEHDTNVYYRRALVLAACFGRAARLPAAGRRHRDEHRTCARSTSISTRRPRSCARRSARKSLRSKRFRARSATPRSPRAAGCSPTCPSLGAAHRVRSSRSSSPRSSPPAGCRRPPMGIAAWLIPSIVAFGTDEQKQRFLPPTFRGEMIWCQLFSEPGAGSDLAGLTTKATKVDGGWRITGQKIWTTAAQVLAVGRAAGPHGPERAEAQRHHLLPARYAQRRRRGEAAARADRQRDVQHRLHRRRVRSRRAGARRGEPRLGGQPQHADRRAGFDRQQRAAVPGQPRRFRGVHPRRPVRPDRAEPGRQADRRGARRQGAQHALDAADAGRRRPDARRGDLQAAVDAHRPGLRRVRGVVVRHRRRDRRSRTAAGQVGRVRCCPAGPPRFTAARRRCSSTSSPSGCWVCPATRRGSLQEGSGRRPPTSRCASCVTSPSSARN